MNRRDFLSWMGVSTLATSLPMAIAACSSPTSTTPPAADSATSTAPPDTASAPGPVNLGTVDDLKVKGSLVVEQPEKIIVVQDPQNPDAVIARTANCNHKNCTVGWQADKGEFVCPCHDSRFALDGSILAGPATEPLKVLTASVENGQVVVTM